MIAVPISRLEIMHENTMEMEDYDGVHLQVADQQSVRLGRIRRKVEHGACHPSRRLGFDRGPIRPAV